MCVRWLATVRSPRNSAAATSRFVRPSATSAATRRSAAVSLPHACGRRCGRARPAPSRSSSSAPSCSKPRAPPRSPRVPAASGARGGGRCRARAARGPAERIADVLVLRDRLLEQRRGRARRPLARRRRGRGSASRARAPTRARAAPRPPPRRREAGSHRRCDRAGAGPRRSRASTSGRSARASPACSPAGRPARARSTAAGSVAVQSATSPRTARCCGGGARTASPRARGPAPNRARDLELAAVDGDRRDREEVLRHLEAVLDERSCARSRGRPRAPSAGPELDPREGPERAALYGSSRSRHSRYSRSSRARASVRSTHGASVFGERLRRFLDEPSSPSAVCELVGECRESGGASGSPWNRRGRPSTARAEVRSTSSSSWSASSSAACAWVALRSAEARLVHASRQWMPAWSAGRKTASREPLRESAGDRRSRARRAGRATSARSSPSSVSASRSVAMCARASTPRPRDGAGGGERPATPLVARVRRRQPERLLGELGRDRRGAAIGGESRGVVEHRGDVCIGRVLRERKVTGAARRGSSTIRRSARGRCRRSSPRSRYRTDESSGCVKRIVPPSRSITCASTRGRARLRERPPARAAPPSRAQRRGERRARRGSAPGAR